MNIDPHPRNELADRSAVPFDPPRRPGSLGRIAHYEVEAFLGRGAFGIVVRAFDEKLQRPVAIKLLSSNYGPETSAYQRFLREAPAAATIRRAQECLDRGSKHSVTDAVTVAAQAARRLVFVAAGESYLAMQMFGEPRPGTQSIGTPIPKPESPIVEPVKRISPRVTPKIAPKLIHSWSKPKPLFGINTPSRELAPTMADDELMIVCAGLEGLYTARRKDRNARFEAKDKLKLVLDPGLIPDLPSITGDALRSVFLTRVQQGITFWESSRAIRDEPFGKPKALSISTDLVRPCFDPNGGKNYLHS